MSLTPPCDAEAEAATLGCMMLDPQCIHDVLGILRRDGTPAFYTGGYQELFEVLVDMWDTGRTIDVITLRDELQSRGLLSRVGGVDALVTLAESVPSAANARYYAAIVARKARMRRLLRLSYDIRDMVAEADKSDGEAAIDAIEQRICEITAHRASEEIHPVDRAIREVLAGLEESGGDASVSGTVPSGFDALDRMLAGGFRPGEMIVVAARPSMGKTSLGLTLALNAASSGTPCGIFSLEMSRQAVCQRILAMRSGVDLHRIRSGSLTEQDVVRLRLAAESSALASLHIDDSAGLTMFDLRRNTRHLVRERNVGMVVVDYLQLVRASSSANRPRHQEVQEISAHLKDLAMRTGIPIIVMSQLNRKPEERVGNRPRMSDLRESGAIEQDADVVILLHREDYYHKTDPEYTETNQLEVIVDKQRNGPTGTVQLYWDAAHTTISAAQAVDIAPRSNPPGRTDLWDVPF